MFTDRYKRSAGIIFFAVLWVAIAAEAARGQAKQEDIAIGYASPSGVMTPLYVAQEQGLFKKHGLGVKELLLLRGTGPAAAQMLVAGTAPIAALGGALVEGAIRGAGIAYIASTSNHLIFSIYSPDFLHLFTFGNRPSGKSQRKNRRGRCQGSMATASRNEFRCSR
jgi:ABC-type nitrate/sulfonate/bicarbonate transport system substrate-binding protein